MERRQREIVQRRCAGSPIWDTPSSGPCSDWHGAVLALEARLGDRQDSDPWLGVTAGSGIAQ
jgi:hypothetical protein